MRAVFLQKLMWLVLFVAFCGHAMEHQIITPEKFGKMLKRQASATRTVFYDIVSENRLLSESEKLCAHVKTIGWFWRQTILDPISPEQQKNMDELWAKIKAVMANSTKLKKLWSAYEIAVLGSLKIVLLYENRDITQSEQIEMLLRLKKCNEYIVKHTS